MIFFNKLFDMIFNELLLRRYKRLFLFSFIAFFLFITLCTIDNDDSDDIILAEIKDKKITLTDFYQRSGLTIRPSNFKKKNITLNNLICEKILAIEAENDASITDNEIIQKKIQGIKEQLMRDKLHDLEASQKVKLDSSKMMDTYMASIREYNVEFYTIYNKQLAEDIQNQLDSLPHTSENILKSLAQYLGEKPQHSVKYDDTDDDVIFDALFSEKLEIGEIIGPKRLTNGSYIIMRVIDWTDKPAIGNIAQQERWNKVKEKLHKIEARKNWETYIKRTMAGKKIEFSEEPFYLLSQWAMERHVNEIKNKNMPDSLRKEVELDDPEISDDEPFFTIDNNVWTVGEFKDNLISHPLVYRTKYLNEKNFTDYFKYAIIDMVRDHYLTEEAYNQSLDKSSDIEKTAEIWRDALIANKQKKKILSSAIEQGLIDRDNKRGLQVYLESVLVDLQNQYSDKVKINNDEYRKIKLANNIDFFAFRSGVPFPAPVPNFPILIGSGNLDYTNKMD